MSGEVKEPIIAGLAAKDLILIAFGTLIGAILSFVATEISAWRRRKEDEKEKTNEIIADVVSFTFKAREMIDDLLLEKNIFLKTKDRDPEAKKRYIEFLAKRLEKISNLAVEEDSYTFQLRRVGNKELLKKFKDLLDVQTKHLNLFRGEVEGSIENEVTEKKSEIQRLSKAFIDHCIEISKINAPKRTLSAPAKKK